MYFEVGEKVLVWWSGNTRKEGIIEKIFELDGEKCAHIIVDDLIPTRVHRTFNGIYKMEDKVDG